MRTRRADVLLLGTAAALLALSALTLWRHNRLPRGITIPPVPAASVRAIELSEGGRTLRLERGRTWEIVGEPRLPGDAARIGALLDGWSRGLEAEARLRPEDDDLSPWGLSPRGRLELRLLGADGPLLELYLGRGEGGGRFFGVPGDATVYQARLPGSAWIDARRETWRDRRLLPVAPAEVVEVRFDGPQGRFAFRRSPPDGPWEAADGTPFPPSQAVLNAVLASLCAARPRSTASAPGDGDPWVDRGSVALRDGRGRTWSLRLGPPTRGGVQVAVAGDPRRFVIDEALAEQVRKGRGSLEDRGILRFAPRPGTTITARRGVRRAVLRLTDRWTLDGGEAAGADRLAEGLSDLRAVEILDHPAPRPGPATIELDVSGAGPERRLHLALEGGRWLAWRDGDGRLFAIRAEVGEGVEALLAGR